MDHEESKRLHSSNVQHLSQLANYYSHSSPALSRFFVSSANEIVHKKSDASSATKSSSCPYCGSIYDADNHSVRMRPKMKLTKKIKQLLCKEMENGPFSLSSHERKLISDYKNRRSTISISCKICGRNNLTECQRRPPKPVVKEVVEVPKKKKKKKKKDTTCGLSIPGSKSQPCVVPSAPKSLPSSPASSVTTTARDIPTSRSTPVAASAALPTKLPVNYYAPKNSNMTSPFLNTNSSKKKSKMKNSHLQQILNQEKKQKSSNTTELQSFLSNL